MLRIFNVYTIKTSPMDYLYGRLSMYIRIQCILKTFLFICLVEHRLATTFLFFKVYTVK